jgi:hypothetical protein
MPTTGARKRTNVKGWGSTPWEKSTGYSTSFRTAMPTAMPTTGARKRTNVKGTFVGYGPSPINPGRPIRRRSNAKGTTFVGYNPRLSLLGADVTYFDGPNIPASSTTSVVPTLPPSAPVYQSTDPSQPYYIPPQQYQYATPYQAPYAVPYSDPSQPYTGQPVAPYSQPPQGPYNQQGPQGRHRRRHHHRQDQQTNSNQLPVMRAPTMSMGSFVGAAAPSPAQQAQMLSTIVARQSNNVAALSTQAGLRGKKSWTSADVDKVSAGLLRKMMSSTNQKPSAYDANLARLIVRAWAGRVGATVMGGSQTFVGDFLGTLGSIMKAPLKAAYWVGTKSVDASVWATRKGVQGIAWGANKVLGRSTGGSPPPPSYPGMPPGMAPAPGMVSYAGPVGMSPQQMAMYQQAAARKAAASQRILAAEAAQEAALTQQQQAQDLQDASDQAAEAESAAQTAEQIAMQAQASANLPETPQALMDTGISGMSGWGGLKSVPPGYVGPNAIAAMQNTPQGQSLRTGASVARAARKNPAVAKKVKKIEVAAKKGDPKAQHQNAVIKAGALADHQRLDALHTHAVVTRKRADMAHAVFRRVLKVGGAPTGAFAKWDPTKKGIITIGADGGKATGNSPQATGQKTQTQKGQAQNYPAIPGVPADVIVALTAASNTFGVPPAVAASVITAARAGDPTAKKELVDASRVYKAAQLGDPTAKRQMAAVIADMKSGYAPAAQKAAVMAAAVGTTKGTKNLKMRKKVQENLTQRYAAADISKQMFPDSVWPASFFKIISYGTGPL